MNVSEVKCPRCFAPVDPSRAISTCRFCGVTIAIERGVGATSGARQHELPYGQAASGTVVLDDAGKNLIAVIKVVRQHTGLGLKEAKELVERAPCVVAEWETEVLKAMSFRQALAAAGARVR